MTARMDIWVSGVPVPKQRPRVTITRRGRVYAYTPREMRGGGLQP